MREGLGIPTVTPFSPLSPIVPGKEVPGNSGSLCCWLQINNGAIKDEDLTVRSGAVSSLETERVLGDQSQRGGQGLAFSVTLSLH